MDRYARLHLLLHRQQFLRIDILAHPTSVEPHVDGRGPFPHGRRALRVALLSGDRRWNDGCIVREQVDEENCRESIVRDGQRNE